MSVAKTAGLLLLLAVIGIHADHHGDYKDHHGDHKDHHGDHKDHHHHDQHDHHHDHNHTHDHHHHHNHTHGPENCDGLNFTLPNEDINKIFGDWVLVWAVADNQEGRDLLSDFASSFLELRLLEDKKTVTFSEVNLFHNKTCSKFYINVTMDDTHKHMMHSIPALSVVEIDGVRTTYNETGHVIFFEACSHCVAMLYTAPEGKYLMLYKLFGEHRDVERLKAAHDEHRKLAECVGIPHDKPLVYDGVADFCHKKSAPEPTDKPADS